jgi:hypothetical protein
LLPADSALLTITPAVAVTPSQQVTSPSGIPLAALPDAAAQPGHPSSPGRFRLRAGGRFDAGASAQLLQLPSRQEDRLAQRLAGLLLTRRRAGITGPLPPTVLQLLKAEFTTTIKPLLPQIAKGLIPNYLPFTRGFVETVKDTGLVAQVKRVVASDERGGGGGGGGNAVAKIQKAQRDAAKIEWNHNLASCLAGGGGAAAIEAYHSYSKLKAVNGLGRADTAKVLNCLRFELRFDTEVKGGDNLLYEKDTVPSVSIPLDFRIDDGYFYGQAPAPFTASLTSFDCTETEVGRTSGPFKVDRLLINALTQFDEELDVLRVEAAVSYEVFPPMVRWREVCHDITQDRYQLGVLYGTFHRTATDNRGPQHLNPSADPRPPRARVQACLALPDATPPPPAPPEG